MLANQGGSPTLSDTQCGLLRTAVQEGYFTVPRKIAAADLAQQTGLSSQEALRELNRALAIMVTDTDLDR